MTHISFEEATTKFPYVMTLIGLIINGFKYTLESRSMEWDSLCNSTYEKIKIFRSSDNTHLVSILQFINRVLPWYILKQTMNERVLENIEKFTSTANKKISRGNSTFQDLLAPLDLPLVSIISKHSVYILRSIQKAHEVKLSFFPHKENKSRVILKKIECDLVADTLGSSVEKKIIPFATVLLSKELSFPYSVSVHASTRRHQCIMDPENLANGLLAALPRAKIHFDFSPTIGAPKFLIPCPCCEIKKGLSLHSGGGGSSEEPKSTLLSCGSVISIIISAKQLNEFTKSVGLGDKMPIIKMAFSQAALNTPNVGTFTCPNLSCKMNNSVVPFKISDSCIGCISSYKQTNNGYFHKITCYKCLIVGCALCGKDEASHVNGFCGQATEEMLKVADEHEHLSRGEKRCPTCKAWTAKDGGCRHMSCKCGTDWCWDHEVPWQAGWQTLGHDRMHGSYSCPGYEAQIVAEQVIASDAVVGPGHNIVSLF